LRLSFGLTSLLFDVVYDKEKDEVALRVAISEQLSGRTRSTSSKTTLSEDQEKSRAIINKGVRP
jgi:hypothetical protein